MPWRIEPHTADLVIACDGPSREAVLADAATALASVVTGRDDPRAFAPDQEITATVEAPDEESLVVAWLSEVLWLLESDDTLWLTGGIAIGTSSDGGLRLTAAGNGAAYDPSVHGQGTEVKAVTYHDLHLDVDRDGQWSLRVVLDI